MCSHLVVAQMMRCGGNRVTSLVGQNCECGPLRTYFVVLLPTTDDLKDLCENLEEPCRFIVPSATCARKLFMFSFPRGCEERQPHRLQHQKRWLFSDPGLGTNATCSTDDAVSLRSVGRREVINSYVNLQFLVVSIIVRAFYSSRLWRMLRTCKVEP